MSKLNCPKCSTTLRVPDDLPDNKRVRCPECETKFLKEDAGPPARSSRREARRDDDRGEDAPRRSKSKGRRPQKKSNAPVLIGAAVAAVLLLGGLAVGGYILLAKDKSEDNPNVPAPVAHGGSGPVAGPNVNLPGRTVNLPDKTTDNPNVPPPVADQGDPEPVPGPNVNLPAKPKAPPPAGGNRVTGLEIGNLAPEIQGEDIDGQTFKLSDYRGKVVVLDFWGHW